jgi:hypothetical protein
MCFLSPAAFRSSRIVGLVILLTKIRSRGRTGWTGRTELITAGIYRVQP